MAQKHPLVSVVPRSEWGALPPRDDIEPVTLPLEKVFITMSTASKPCYTKEECLRVVADLQNRHITNDGAPDIRYNFLVGGDGNVYEGRGWLQKPQLSREERYFEDKSLDIAYIGTYEAHPLVMYGWLCDLLLIGIKKEYLKLGKYEEYDKAEFSKMMEERKLAEEEKEKQLDEIKGKSKN